MAERVSFHLEKLYVRNETHWVTGCGLTVLRAEGLAGQASISSSREYEACLGNFGRFRLKSLRANEEQGCSSVGKCLPSMGKSLTQSSPTLIQELEKRPQLQTQVKEDHWESNEEPCEKLRSVLVFDIVRDCAIVLMVVRTY